MEWKSFLAGAAAGTAITVSAIMLLPREPSQLVPAPQSQVAEHGNLARQDSRTNVPVPSPTDMGERSVSQNRAQAEPISNVGVRGQPGSEQIDPLQIEQTPRAATSIPVTDAHQQLLGETGRADKTSGNPGEVHSALEQEPKDYDWSYFMEQSLRQYLSSHHEIANFDVVGIECRTTICEIQAFGVDQSAGPRWGIIMHDLTKQPWADFGQTGSSSSTIDGRLVVLTHLHRLSKQQ